MQSSQPEKRPTAKLQTRKLERPTAPAPKAGQVLSRQQILSQLSVMATKGASALEMRNWAKQAGADPMELEHMVDQASRGANSGRLTAVYTRTSARSTGAVNVKSTRSKGGLVWIAVGVALLGGGGYMSWRHYEAAQAVAGSAVTPWWAAVAMGLVVVLKGVVDLRKVG
jgi:hypothetical protein